VSVIDENQGAADEVSSPRPPLPIGIRPEDGRRAGVRAH